MASVLKSFELPASLYADDVSQIASDTISHFGIREWQLVVMTNEIHGHLGIYSTLGAKMGLRVLEYFEEQGLGGHVQVLSFAGSEPPVSCLNDGLQISTGATVGHGLFNVSDSPEKRAEAVFSCHGMNVGSALKPEYETAVAEDIKRGVEQFRHSREYWDYIRRLAIKYWAEWDRNKIFTIFAK